MGKREYRVTKAGELMTPAADPNGIGRRAKGAQKGLAGDGFVGGKGAGGRSGKGTAAGNLQTSTASKYSNYWRAWSAGSSMPTRDAAVDDHHTCMNRPAHELLAPAELSTSSNNNPVSRRWGCRLVSTEVIDIG